MGDRVQSFTTDNPMAGDAGKGWGSAGLLSEQGGLGGRDTIHHACTGKGKGSSEGKGGMGQGDSQEEGKG
jgi:hypothetical protein